MGDYRAWQRAYWQALGILEGMAAQGERLYDHLPSEDRRVSECYDALIEALEALERQMRRRLARDEPEVADELSD
ncbi:MAG: hypothetical protein CUN51_04540 [Candidatus Thermofonsia Clade 1 bacterium]|jgi:hypothetical protein|uniref:Uncharacterized protein n=1 Tax=Candidatus Thermofonsia Clade 1 bacterium TaxID=2364210 RepID=A0A2M8P0R1_9CHLR|nr:MAG: hypothetical protein CUN51_04540 [Candidatus Thermofonsia Clade 1 bacterium]